ncbi:hypothetical protein V6N12_054917 [Hibiscus sabdariffa]|uniref:Rx N-terminal domain-containing protein n=1 Tax=Hibiscus sabdariffa TaxID=183260 RepID=A0ABR2D3M0_9ROSI
MAFIGDAALSKLLDLLLGKSIDSALNFVTDHKQVYEQLKEWKSILPDIKAVLNHAEEKQIRDEGVKRWLEDLQDLAYDVDDILDEFAYEELRLKLHKTQAQAGTSKVRKLLPTCCTGGDFTPSSFLFKNSMIPKLKEITARLNGLSTRRSSLGLSEILSQAASYERKKPVRLQPTSVVDGSVEYVGRHNEKREMLDLLKTNNSEGVCVLSIIGMGGMENVNVQDAREARLNEKSGINKLVLQWSSDFEKPTRKNEVEEQVLDSLHPSKKLEQLVIENFGGAKFSTWIADSSFRNLSTLKLLDCKNCKSLPPIGMLPLLKSFLVRGLDEVHKIGIEFFGEDQSNAFASLETLSFESLPNWKEWEACEGDKQVSRFPSLLKLLIIQCPQLLGRLPTRLQSLQRLEIYECRRLVVSISSFPSLCELSVVGCEELVDECSSAPVEEVASLQSVSFVHFKV